MYRYGVLIGACAFIRENTVIVQTFRPTTATVGLSFAEKNRN